MLNDFLKNQLSIGGKLFIAIAGSSLLITTLAFAFLIPMDIDRLKQINKDEAQIFIKTFNRDFIRVLLMNTTEESVSLTEHLREFPLVLSVTLTNNNGNKLFTYRQSNYKNNSSTDEKIYEEISYMGGNYGHINLIISNSRLDERIGHYLQLITPLILSLIVIAFLLARVLRNHIAKPIIKLSASVSKIANNRNYAHRIHSNSTDEIGMLYKGFNDLLHTVSVTQASLAKEKEQAIFTLNSITDAVIRTDQLGRIEYINPVAESMMQLTDKEANKRATDNLFSLITTHDGQPINNPITQCINDNKIISNKYDHIMILGRDNKIDVEYSASPIHDQENKITGTVMVFKEVSQEREAARQLTFLASHDSLTGIYNRRAFEKHINRSIYTAQYKSHHHVLFFMDLDKFKIVNDNLGHLAGDEVLRNVAAILANNIRETDILARLGGDEFGILLTNCNEKQSLKVAEKIRAAIEAYRLSWDNDDYQIGICIGLVEITSASKNLTDVINAADSACYTAKNDGRNCVRVFSIKNKSSSNITHLPFVGKK